MIDGLGRTIDYLRISVTDRCNLRCCYCMPEERVPLKSHEEILTYEEILKVCRAAASLGIDRVKITGGEPLVRRGIEALVREIKALNGIRDVTMTSNGILLKDKAKELKEAGLSSINISLDTLDSERFARITRRDCFASVMEGIESAKSAGLFVKLNCAVMEELTSKEVLAFAHFSERTQIPVRFIELMPIGQGSIFHAPDNDALAKILSEAFGGLRKEERPMGNGPAFYVTWGEGKGRIGFISAVHHRFCASCNRVRLTSDGFLKLCLDHQQGVDLKAPLRQKVSENELAALMQQAILQKPGGHAFEALCREKGPNMNQIGG